MPFQMNRRPLLREALPTSQADAFLVVFFVSLGARVELNAKLLFSLADIINPEKHQTPTACLQ